MLEMPSGKLHWTMWTRLELSTVTYSYSYSIAWPLVWHGRRGKIPILCCNWTTGSPIPWCNETRGCSYPMMHWDQKWKSSIYATMQWERTIPLVHRMTETIENITFPQTTYVDKDVLIFLFQVTIPVLRPPVWTVRRATTFRIILCVNVPLVIMAISAIKLLRCHLVLLVRRTLLMWLWSPIPPLLLSPHAQFAQTRQERVSSITLNSAQTPPSVQIPPRAQFVLNWSLLHPALRSQQQRQK